MLQIPVGNPRSNRTAEPYACQTVRVTYHTNLNHNAYPNRKDLILLEGGYVRAVWVVDHHCLDSPSGIASLDMNSPLLQGDLTLDAFIDAVLEHPEYIDVYMVSGEFLGGSHFYFDL